MVREWHLATAFRGLEAAPTKSFSQNENCWTGWMLSQFG